MPLSPAQLEALARGRKIANSQGLGGKATVKKHGPRHMAKIGRKGWEATVRAGHGDVAFREATSWRREHPSEHVRSCMEWLDANGFVGYEVEHVIEHAGRVLAIDLAFPEQMVGVEINGAQHYAPAFGMTEEEWRARHERDQCRLALKRAAGWAIYELDGRNPDWDGLEAWLKEHLSRVKEAV
jgi:hypothetical protein